MPAATAIAHSNIALAKYWGKADVSDNRTAVPSLSMTLTQLYTRTCVAFDASLPADVVLLGGKPAADAFCRRVVRLLDQVRRRADLRQFARVDTTNSFPTAAGLASSASGFAALAMAATRSAGLELSKTELSALARSASASAARSVFGGYVALDAGAESARPVLDAPAFPLAMLVCVVASAEKAMGSTQGMLHTQRTSPYYPSWQREAPAVFEAITQALLAKDIEQLGPLVEHSSLMMHASMWAARPALDYLLPATLEVIQTVRGLQRRSVPAYVTMDAGPNVKVLTLPSFRDSVLASVSQVAGVERVIACETGPDAHWVET